MNGLNATSNIICACVFALQVFGDKASLIAALEQGDYSPTGPYGKASELRLSNDRCEKPQPILFIIRLLIPTGSILQWNVQAVGNFGKLL